MEESEQYGIERDDKGKFKPGNKAATNRGANRVSMKVKESIVNFLELNIDAVQESFDTLKPKEKLDFISSILPYAAPKLSSQTVENEHSGGITIRFENPGDYVYPSQDKGNTGEQEGL
jgi:hypothetical protein